MLTKHSFNKYYKELEFTLLKNTDAGNVNYLRSIETHKTITVGNYYTACDKPTYAIIEGGQIVYTADFMEYIVIHIIKNYPDYQYVSDILRQRLNLD